MARVISFEERLQTRHYVQCRAVARRSLRLQQPHRRPVVRPHRPRQVPITLVVPASEHPLTRCWRALLWASRGREDFAILGVLSLGFAVVGRLFEAALLLSVGSIPCALFRVRIRRPPPPLEDDSEWAALHYRVRTSGPSRVTYQ